MSARFGMRPARGKGVEVNGEWITIAEACRRFGIRRRTVEDRIYRQQLSKREALTRPLVFTNHTKGQTMTVGPSLFDHVAAQQAANRGMAQAEANADADWRRRVEAAIGQLARQGRFISDDVRKLAGDPPEGTHPNAMGALVNAARAAGRIEAVGFGKSARVKGHSNRVIVWAAK